MAHVCQRSVRFGNWLYIRTYHDGYHLFNKEMLYDLSKDPYELHDVAADYPEVCRQAVYYLMQWHDERMAFMPFTVDPLWTVMQEGGPFHAKGYLPEYTKRLAAAGRAHAVPELMLRHSQEFTKG